MCNKLPQSQCVYPSDSTYIIEVRQYNYIHDSVFNSLLDVNLPQISVNEAISIIEYFTHKAAE